jgi:ubiquinone biosynthesis protein COQ4
MLEQNTTIRPELINALQGFMAFVKNPDDTDSVFDIAEALSQTEVTAASIQYLKSIPEAAQLMEERYIAPTPDLKALLELPKDSLGYVYSSRMITANFDPEFYRKVVVQDDTTYFFLRMRQTHDIWHAVTGFSVNVSGEIGLQSFQLAQNHSPLAVLLIAGALLNTIQHSDNLSAITQAIAQGYNMGLQSKLFFAQKWEEHWDKSLTDWRSELGVVAVDYLDS